MKKNSRIWLASLLAILIMGSHLNEAKAEMKTEMNVSGNNAQFVAEFHPNTAKLLLIHLVNPGDTLWNIALTYGITLRELQQINPALELDKPIHLNQKITVSLKETAVTPIVKPGTSQPASSYQTHTVKAGQTAFSIARLYGVSADDIMKRNQLNLKSTLKVGDELFIPEKASVIPYVVQPGDTLTKISNKFNIPVRRLSEHNRLNTKNLIIVGQTLEIPK